MDQIKYIISLLLSIKLYEKEQAKKSLLTLSNNNLGGDPGGTTILVGAILDNGTFFETKTKHGILKLTKRWRKIFKNEKLTFKTKNV